MKDQQMITDYKTPPGDLGLLACANRSMSAQLTSIRGAMDGAMRAAGDLPERVRMLVSENNSLRARLAQDRERIATMFDDSPNAEMFRQDIADAIRALGDEQ
jgi:hypothetical protein